MKDLDLSEIMSDPGPEAQNVAVERDLDPKHWIKVEFINIVLSAFRIRICIQFVSWIWTQMQIWIQSLHTRTQI